MSYLYDPRAGGFISSDEDSSEDEASNKEASMQVDESMSERVNAAASNLKMSADALDNPVSAICDTVRRNVAEKEPDASKQIEASTSSNLAPKPGTGADPSKPKARKAKDLRRERKLQKEKDRLEKMCVEEK